MPCSSRRSVAIGVPSARTSYVLRVTVRNPAAISPTEATDFSPGPGAFARGVTQLQAEPRLGVCPVGVARRFGDPQRRGGLADGQPGEEAQLDQLGFPP